MNDQSHLSPEELAAYAADQQAGLSAGERSGRAGEHLTSCEECAQRLEAVRQFVTDLDDSWNRERLKAMGVDHPSPAEIEALWLRAGNDVDLADVRRHLDGCPACQRHLDRLEEGFTALSAEDPLGQPSWASMVGKRFAAGIEMVVEAAQGSYTSAAGMIRDVMTPQARAQLAPAPALAMGRRETGREAVSWNDATFLTDEMSGEITGSTDPNTGRGIITVVINKSGTYVASPPIVDLVNEMGTAIATQFALDLGDRYSAHFENLDQGRYLVGIREPGDASPSGA